MAKPLIMTINVEEIAFGRVFRALDAMPGVVSIDIQAESKRGAAAPAPAGRVGGKGTRTGAATIECIILGALGDGSEARTRDELRTAITRAGKAATSMPDALRKLKEKRHVKVAAGGKYAITVAGKERFVEACAISNGEG